MLGFFALSLPTASTAQTSSPAQLVSKGCSAQQNRQFDFWLGKWRVSDGSGVSQGSNDVTSEFAGCVVQEHWAGADGSRGSSFNTYLPGRRQWQQTWVDASGLTLQLYGNLHGSRMVLEGTRIARRGKVGDRITWTPLPDGRVRQHWQETGADGKWKDVFDGYYTRIGAN